MPFSTIVKFCLVSTENRTRQIAEALLSGGKALLTDERLNSLDKRERIDLQRELYSGELMFALLGERYSNPTLKEYYDRRKCCLVIELVENMGWTDDATDAFHYAHEAHQRQSGAGYNPSSGPIFDEAFTFTYTGAS